LKNVFERFFKTAREPADLTDAGRLFYKRGPASAKDLSPAAVFERGIGPLQIGDKRSCSIASDGWQLQPDVVSQLVISRHTVNARISHDGHLESYPQLDRKPVSFA